MGFISSTSFYLGFVLYRLDLSCSDFLSGLVKARPDLSRLAQTCPEISNINEFAKVSPFMVMIPGDPKVYLI